MSGKSKGAGFEREICKKLSRFIDPKGTDTLFWRSAMSGGRATVQNRKKGIENKTQLGDITCVSKAGLWLTETFVIECKFWKDLDITSCLIKRKGKLIQFWREVKKVAKKHDKHPLLIAKQNNIETLVLTTINGWTSYKTYRHNDTLPIVEFYDKNRTVLIFKFREMFQ